MSVKANVEFRGEYWMSVFESKNLEERLGQLERKVSKLEDYQAFRKHFISLNEGEVVLQSMGGGAKIVLKKNGEISITGNSKIAIKSRGRLFIVSDGEMTMKGSKISEN